MVRLTRNLVINFLKSQPNFTSNSVILAQKFNKLPRNVSAVLINLEKGGIIWKNNKVRPTEFGLKDTAKESEPASGSAKAVETPSPATYSSEEIELSSPSEDHQASSKAPDSQLSSEPSVSVSVAVSNKAVISKHEDDQMINAALCLRERRAAKYGYESTNDAFKDIMQLWRQKTTITS